MTEFLPLLPLPPASRTKSPRGVHCLLLHTSHKDLASDLKVCTSLKTEDVSCDLQTTDPGPAAGTSSSSSVSPS